MLLFNQVREKEIRDFRGFIAANVGYSLHPTMADPTRNILRLVVRKVLEQTTFGERLSSGNYWILQGRSRIGVLDTRLEDDSLILEWIVMAPQARGTGASRQAMAFLDSLALNTNVASIKLRVNRRNIPAFRLYQKEGYTVTGHKWFYYEYKASRLDKLISCNPLSAALRFRGGLISVGGGLSGHLINRTSAVLRLGKNYTDMEILSVARRAVLKCGAKKIVFETSSALEISEVRLLGAALEMQKCFK